MTRSPTASSPATPCSSATWADPTCSASIGFTRDELADKLYDSLHNKLMTLPDVTRVYPAHGAGSACGKNLSTDLWSTMGDQKATNYALRAPDKPTFMGLVTEGQPPAPSYFVYDAILNRKAHGLLDENARDADVNDLRAGAQGDRRRRGAGRRPHSRRVRPGSPAPRHQHRPQRPLHRVRRFGPPPDADIVLVTEPGQQLEGKNRLARIGFDRVIGYLNEPYQVMLEHQDDVQVASRLTAKAFDRRASEMTDLQIVDVRNPGEAAAGTIPNAITIPVGQLPTGLASSTSPSRPSCIAPAATGRRSPRACCGSGASPT